MIDYSPTFGHLKHRFVTANAARREADDRTRAAIDLVARLLETEVEANLEYDHFHPEVAGPLQQSLYFLSLVRGDSPGCK